MSTADTTITTSRAPGLFTQVRTLAPGVLLTALIATVAFMLRSLPGVSVLSPLILAIIIGMVVRNSVGSPSWARPGAAFSMRRLLRLGIILLGLQLTAAQVGQVGVQGVLMIGAGLIATFFATKLMGRWLGVDPKLAELIAAGTSICGASAVIATNTVTRASDEDAAYGVACVTIFGSLAMFIYPMLAGPLGLSARSYGMWAGASIHEIAQVAGAADKYGLQIATISKLTRVMMLAPLVITLGAVAARRTKGGESQAKAPLPWFVLGFVALTAINSVWPLPAPAAAPTKLVTSFLLAMALAAMGLDADIRKLAAKGPRPLVLGAMASVFISLFSLSLIELFG